MKNIRDIDIALIDDLENDKVYIAINSKDKEAIRDIDIISDLRHMFERKAAFTKGSCMFWLMAAAMLFIISPICTIFAIKSGFDIALGTALCHAGAGIVFVSYYLAEPLKMPLLTLMISSVLSAVSFVSGCYLLSRVVAELPPEQVFMFPALAIILTGFSVILLQKSAKSTLLAIQYARMSKADFSFLPSKGDINE